MTVQGSCLCGAVTFSTDARLRDVAACHCRECRKQSGHFVAATAVEKSDLALSGQDRLTWFTSSPGYRRGFCGACGSLLFWENTASDLISVMAGSLDGVTGLTTSEHIYVAEKGDYYQIADGLPQFGGDSSTATVQRAPDAGN